jgi:hypothetical protein
MFIQKKFDSSNVPASKHAGFALLEPGLSTGLFFDMEARTILCPKGFEHKLLVQEQQEDV